MISSAKHCTIFQYMEARFENNLDVLGEGTREEQENALQNIHIEYCDLLGPEAMPDLPLLTTIHNTKIRIEAVSKWISLLRASVIISGAPYERAITRLQTEYRHTSLAWNDDAEDFERQLSRIEMKEAKYKLRLAEDEKSLENTRIAAANTSPLEPERLTFINKLEILSVERHMEIDEHKMTMEKLGNIEARHNKAAREAKQN